MARTSGKDRGSRPLRVVMDILVVLAVLVLVRLVILFFGPLAASSAGAWYLAVTRALVPPIAGVWAVRTPYGGAFSVDAGIVIVVLLAVEWLLALVAKRPPARSPREDRTLEHH